MRTASCAERQPIGHGSGTANVAIEVLVSDMDTKAPIANAKVTFFNAAETEMLMMLKYEKMQAGKNLSAPPTGTIATTGTDGKVLMRGAVRYSQVWYDDGSKKDYIYPAGKLLVEHPRYLSHIVWAMDAQTAKVVAYVTCD